MLPCLPSYMLREAAPKALFVSSCLHILLFMLNQTMPDELFLLRHFRMLPCLPSYMLREAAPKALFVSSCLHILLFMLNQTMPDELFCTLFRHFDIILSYSITYTSLPGDSQFAKNKKIGAATLNSIQKYSGMHLTQQLPTLLFYNFHFEKSCVITIRLQAHQIILFL